MPDCLLHETVTTTKSRPRRVLGERAHRRGRESERLTRGAHHALAPPPSVLGAAGDRGRRGGWRWRKRTRDGVSVVGLGGYLFMKWTVEQ